MASPAERLLVTREGALSAFRAVVSRALAAAVVTGIDNAASEERPLSQLQQIDIVTMAVMEYADALRDFESAVSFEASIEEIRARRSGERR